MRSGLITGLGGLMLAGAILAGSVLAQDLGDPDAGRKLARQCQTCHGLDGYAKIPIAPHIGGEPADYLSRQLMAFRDGTREHEMMTVVAKSLSDTQIADLAAWYASQKVSAELTADPQSAPQACVACHGADGMAVAEGVPNLAGEANIYIDTQLKAFRSGKRKNETMSSVAADLSDEDIRAVADWYAAVKLKIEKVK